MSAALDMSAFPDWLREGATVAKFTRGRGLVTQGQALEVTVERITRTQVRVAYGTRETRFRRIDYDATGAPSVWEYREGGSWGVTWQLRATDDPEVLAVYERSRQATIANQAEDLALKWRRDSDTTAARQIADLLVDAGIITSYEAPAS